MNTKTFESSYPFVKGIRTNVELINTTQDLLNHIQEIERRWKARHLWFRGLSHASYDLIPRIYRKNVWKYNVEDANEIYTEFLRRAKPFIKTQGEYSRWEWYQIMQHYGVPTRLLDWTEGAMIALFFALRDVNHVGVPCVWVLDPWWLNRVSSNNDALYYTSASYQEEIDKKALPHWEDDTNLPDYPVAVLPSHIDVRITSQKSVFTIHGKKENGFLELSREHDKDARIIKLRINGRNAKTIRKQLETLGITETALFPDLEGLAREIKWDFDMR